MNEKITPKDKEILEHLLRYKILTVPQLAAISQRTQKAVRKSIRSLSEQRSVSIGHQGLGQKRGRPGNLVMLTSVGLKALDLGDGIKCPSLDQTQVDHRLLLNWFLIHLFAVERAVPVISVHVSESEGNEFNLPSYDKFQKKETCPNKNPEDGSQLIPDGVFSMTHKERGKSLLFFIEVDLGTETIASPKRYPNDIRQKILNYQTWFRNGAYKRFEQVFDSSLNGFRLLFLANTEERLAQLCRLVREMPPSDFVWLAEQEKMFAHGISPKIWIRSGKIDEPRQSILGNDLACDATVMDKIRD